MNNVRCKFRCTQVAHLEASPGNVSAKITLAAHYDQKNADDRNFAKYTPQGELSFICDNPAVLPFFTPGKQYYLDLSEVPAEVKA